MKKWILGFVAASAVTASPTASAVGEGFYAGVGTLGVNLGYKVGANPNFGIRVGANRFDYRSTLNHDDVEYRGELKLNSWEVLADWHPFANGIALTAGFLLNDNRVSARARLNANGTVTINRRQYSGANPNVRVKGRLGEGLTPYLGIGYVSNPSAAKGLRLNAAVGVVFQQPDVGLAVSGVVDSTGRLEADRAAAERRLEKEFDKLRHYPVLTLGLSYSF